MFILVVPFCAFGGMRVCLVVDVLTLTYSKIVYEIALGFITHTLLLVT